MVEIHSTVKKEQKECQILQLRLLKQPCLVVEPGLVLTSFVSIRFLEAIGKPVRNGMVLLNHEAWPFEHLTPKSQVFR